LKSVAARYTCVDADVNKKKIVSLEVTSEEETGGISYSLTDDDIKEYMVEVISEKKKS
jgi:hypothetical protein